MVTFKFFQELEGELTEKMREKLEERVPTAFYLRHSFTYERQNVEDGKIILFHKSLKGIPWMPILERARPWLREQEELRLNVDNIERLNTNGALYDLLMFSFQLLWIEELSLWEMVNTKLVATKERCSVA